MYLYRAIGIYRKVCVATDYLYKFKDYWNYREPLAIPVPLKISVFSRTIWIPLHNYVYTYMEPSAIKQMIQLYLKASVRYPHNLHASKGKHVVPQIIHMPLKVNVWCHKLFTCL